MSTVPKKDISILLPYLGLQSNEVAKRLKSCVYKFYSCVNLKIVFQSTRCIKSFFPYKDRINIKWDQFDILAKGKTDYHCKIKETLYIQELEPAFNVNVGIEKLMLY